MIRLDFCLMFRSRQKRSISAGFLACFAYPYGQKAKKEQKPTQKLATQATLHRLLSNLFDFRGGKEKGLISLALRSLTGTWPEA